MIKFNAVERNELKGINFDAFICASGYEERSIFQATVLNLQTNRKIVLSYPSNEKSNKTNNDMFFSNSSFEFINVNGSITDENNIHKLFDEILKSNLKNQRINIYIDYSCMTRNIYAQILLLASSSVRNFSLHLFFGYSHSVYSPSTQVKSLNRIVEPITGYCNLSLASNPTSLIICLGNEFERAYGLKEYFDADTFIFKSDKQNSPEFALEVESVNQDLIAMTKAEHIYEFPLHDLKYTDFMLKNLCSTLIKDYRVVIAPCGPKPFTLVSLINSIYFKQQIEVWRISPGIPTKTPTPVANGKTTIIEVTFSQ